VLNSLTFMCLWFYVAFFMSLLDCLLCHFMLCFNKIVMYFSSTLRNYVRAYIKFGLFAIYISMYNYLVTYLLLHIIVKIIIFIFVFALKN
jgi:uncharacterized membrane protein